MAQNEEAIQDAGAQIVWVLEQDTQNQPGTAEGCRDFMDGRGSEAGLCVGDAETEPAPGTFDRSPLATFRDFDIIVPLASMEIVFATDHGTPGGNDNLSGDAILEAVREVTGR